MRDDPAIISNKDWDSGRNKGFVFAQIDNVWKVNIGDGANRKDINNIGVISDGKWHHLAMVVDRESRKLRIFQDGDKKGEDDISLIGDMTSGLNINIAQDGTGAYSIYFKGLADEIRTWSTARTIQQIQRTMYERLTGDEEGLAGYWTMEERSESVLSDRTGNGNDGVPHGPEWVEGVPLAEGGRTPLFPKAVVSLDRTVNLSWKNPSRRNGIQAYTIYRDQVKINEMMTSEVSEIPEIWTYNDRDLLLDHSYCYTVTAVYDDKGEGHPSDRACADIASAYTMTFDGQDDYVELRAADRLGVRFGTFTVEAWIRPGGFEARQPVLGVLPGLFLGIGTHRRPYMSFRHDEPEDANDLEGNTILSENVWYHNGMVPYPHRRACGRAGDICQRGSGCVRGWTLCVSRRWDG